MRGRLTLFVCCLAALALMPFVGASDAQDSADLRPPSAFAGMSDQQARSRALFTEAAKVIRRTTISSAGPGSRGPVAIPCPVPRSGWASWLRRGSTAAPRVLAYFEPGYGECRFGGASLGPTEDRILNERPKA